MKHFLFHMFVLLPLALLETAGAVFAVLGICSLAGVPVWGETSVGGNELTGQIAMTVIGLLAVLLIGRLDVKIRGFDKDDGAGFWVTYLLSPIRLPLQLIGGVFAFIGIFWDVIEDEPDDDSPFQNITYVLFHFSFVGGGSGSRKERFGEGHIKSRNILIQIFVMLPVAALQLLMCVLIYQGISSSHRTDDWQIFLPILWFVILFVLAIISTKLRGHEAADEYYDKNYVYEKRNNYSGEGDEPTEEKLDARHQLAADRGLRDYQGMDDFEGYRKKRGGWTSYIRLVTVFCLLFSPILVFCQIISIIIAVFTDPYSGRIFSWYGEIDYRRCNSAFLQKILHFFFDFVVLA